MATREFIFIRIPRTASSSICSALNLEVWHETALEKKEKHSNWDNVFKFAIVRNPIDRFISAFSFLSIFKGKDVNKFLMETDFTEFCKNDFNDFILKPQTDYILDEQGNLAVDFVGRYENLAEDWKTICKKIGVDVHLPIIGKSDQRVEIDEHSRSILMELYRKDFEYLNY